MSRDADPMTAPNLTTGWPAWMARSANLCPMLIVSGNVTSMPETLSVSPA
jgi:hypothetical protein